MLKQLHAFAFVAVFALSLAVQGTFTFVVAAATQEQIALIDFTNDVVGSAPALGGPNQPTSLFARPGTTLVVESSANGINTKPVVLTAAAPNSFGSVDYAFTPVAEGVLRVEATVAFDRLLWGFFLQTTTCTLCAVVTRLDATDAGEIVDDKSRSVVGHYVAGQPFRVRVDVDMTAKSWSATIDNELDGFGDDPVASNLPFENPLWAIPYVGSVNASLAVFPVLPLGGSVAYDDIAVFVPVVPDTTAPTITFSGNAGTYTVDETIFITCEATDDLSGIATTTCPDVASGPATDYVGSTATTSWTLTATATDNAGNFTSASATFTVTVTADGICRLSVSLGIGNAVCSQVASIATTQNAAAKVGKLQAFDNFLAAQSSQSVPADMATLLSRLAHLL